MTPDQITEAKKLASEWKPTGTVVAGPPPPAASSSATTAAQQPSANDTPALSLLRKSADKGDADAQYRLGLMYAHGPDVPRDDVQADMWFNLAAGGGNDLAAKSRDRIEARMTPEQIAEAKKLAVEWKPT